MQRASRYAIIRSFLCACLWMIPVAYLLLSFLLLVLAGRNTYDTILRWFSDWRPTAFDTDKIIEGGFTPRWYVWVQAYRLPMMAGLVLALLVYGWYSRRIWAFLGRFWREVAGIVRLMIDTYRGLTLRQKGWLWLVFGVLWVYRLYDYRVYPIHPDEACSYLYFARQGWLVTATNYTLPNNHVLFNLFCAALSKLPGLSPKMVMRLPSLVADSVLFYGLFCLFCRWGGFSRALLVVIWTAPCYLISYYAIHGRGYQCQDICALVGGLAAWTCWCGKGREERKGYALFVVSTVAGLYINPTYLYHFTALVLFAGYFAWKRREMATFRSLAGAAGLVGALTLIVYLPLMLASGWSALSEGTKWSGVTGYGWLITGLPDLAYDFKMMFNYGRPGFYVGFVLAIGVLYLYWKGKIRGAFYDNAAIYGACVAISLIIWSLHAKRYPMDRTLCFLALALYMIFINACYDCWKQYFPRVSPWVIGGLVLIKTAGSIRSIFWEGWATESMREMAFYPGTRADLEQLAGLHPSSWQITRSDDYYSMYLRLYLVEKGDSGTVIWDKRAARGEVIFLPECYRGAFSLAGYHLWAGGKWTVEGNYRMDIYVRDKLLPKVEH